MTRLHPFEHAFAVLADAHFSAMRDQALREHRDLKDRAQFVSLPGVQRLLTDMESPALLAEHPEAAGEYVTVLYVAYRFWEAGCHTLGMSRERLEAALESPPLLEPPIVPHSACYIQLPERWFWAQIDADEPHEPLDGMFVVEDTRGGGLSTLTVLGLRADRPGFSQIALTVIPDDLGAALAEVSDFAPRLDGGDAAGLKSVTTPWELLRLTALALHDAAVSGEVHGPFGKARRE